MSMTPDRAVDCAFPNSDCNNGDGMRITEYARIQFIAAALHGITANSETTTWAAESIAEDAVNIAEKALKFGGYIE